MAIRSLIHSLIHSLIQLKNTVALRMEVKELRDLRNASNLPIDGLDPELAKYARDVSIAILELLFSGD
jgi:hypothetical protein